LHREQADALRLLVGRLEVEPSRRRIGFERGARVGVAVHDDDAILEERAEHGQLGVLQVYEVDLA
jgi:hypothetical protein